MGPLIDSDMQTNSQDLLFRTLTTMPEVPWYDKMMVKSAYGILTE